MSVLVKGMSIPDNCESCAFATGFGFCLAKSDNFCGYTNDRKRPEWCPLVEVPEPHGRLIDADYLGEHLYICETNGRPLHIMELDERLACIDEVPTVIEAEGE